jgi:hypothetical protein
MVMVVASVPASGIPASPAPTVIIPGPAPTPAPAAAIIPWIVISSPVTAVIPRVVPWIVTVIISAPTKIHVEIPSPVTIIVAVQVICDIYVYLVVAGYLNAIGRLMEFHDTVCILIIPIFIRISCRIFRIPFIFIYSRRPSSAVIGVHVYVYITFRFQSNLSIVADNQYLCRFLLLFLRDCIFGLYFFFLVIVF